MRLGVCVNVSAGAFVPKYTCGGQRTALGVGACLPLFCGRVSCHCCIQQASWLASSQEFCSLCPEAAVGVPALQRQVTLLYMGSENLKPGPDLCVAGILPTEPLSVEPNH